MQVILRKKKKKLEKVFNIEWSLRWGYVREIKFGFCNELSWRIGFWIGSMYSSKRFCGEEPQ